jgi:hypothetical protein
MHIEAASFWPLAFPRCHCGVRVTFSRTGFSLASDSTVGVGARVLVGVDQLLALPGAAPPRDDLLGEDAVLLRGDRR